MNKIDNFLNKFNSKNTKASYKSFLNNYFKVLKTNPETYFNSKRDYKKDIELYLNHLKDTPPLSIRGSLSCIKSFLSENDIDFKDKYWKSISKRIKGSKPWTEKKIPSPNELKRILTHGDARSRSFFLILLSSGMRIGELCQIRIKDLYLNEKPTRIRIQGKYTKSGDARDTFITDEAKNSLKEWLNIREDYIKKNVESLNIRFDYKITKPEKEERVYPFKPSAGRTMWNHLIKKCDLFELDDSTKRLKMNVHRLRSYFRTKLGDIIRTDVIETLMGHEGYLTGSYRDYDINTLRKNYLKGCHKLLIFETEADISEVKEELLEKDKQIRDMQKTLDEMKAQITELRLEKLEKINGIKRK